MSYKRTKWSFFGSQISSLLGRNRFEKQDDAILAFWKKSDPDTYTQAIERTQAKEIKTDKEIVTAVTEKSNEAKEIIKEIATIKGEKERKEKIEELAVKLKDVVDDTTTVEDVKRSLVSHVNQTRGIRDEETGILLYEKKEKKVVTQRNDKFYKLAIAYGHPKDGKMFTLGGKVDGITDDVTGTGGGEEKSQVIVEVKNRQRKLLGMVPAQEYLQVQVYMFLTNITEAHLVECYGTKTAKHVVKFDSTFVDDILDELRKLATCMDKLIEDQKSQDDFIKTRRLPNFFYLDPDDLEVYNGQDCESGKNEPTSVDA